MKKQLLLIFLLVSAYQSFAQTTVADSFLHNGIMRTYTYYVPANYDGTRAYPLVFNLHGYSSIGYEQAFYGDFKPIADTAGFIVVHPDGTIQPATTDTRFWNVGFFPSAIDDVDFVEQMIDSLSASYFINPNRIYATGMSNGGFMSYELACKSNRFAAIASVTGSMTNSFLANCNPAKPIPVMQIHGTADATVPYNGNTNFQSVDSVVSYWVNHNNCPATPLFDSIPNIVTIDNASAEHYVWATGDSNTTVELYKVINGGHTWPGAGFNIGVTCQDFSASKEIWRFFSQYGDELPLSEIKIKDLASGFKLWPNPANDKINLSKVDEADGIIRIFDFSGKLQNSIIFNSQQIEIATYDLAPGLYILEFNNANGSRSMKFIKQ
jgi:polyhydroxybutyrate depolymerase